MSALLLMVSLSGLAPVGAHAGLDAWQKNWRSLPAPEAIDSLPIQVLALIHPPVIVEDGFDGRLLFGRRMGPTEGVWMRTKDTFTVPDVPRALRKIAKVIREKHPGGPDMMIGDISKRGGGRFPPHHSHRSGRDVDLRYYLKEIKAGDHKYHFVTRFNFDVERMWTFLDVVVQEDMADLIYIDFRHQKLLWKYARKEKKIPSKDLLPILSYPRARNHPDALVKHARGHHNHIHIRFKAPEAQARGERWSIEDVDRMQRRLDLVQRGRFELIVRRGDTLGALAEANGVSVKDLRKWNRLSKRSLLRPGKVLKVLATQ